MTKTMVDRDPQEDTKIHRGKRSRERGPARYWYTGNTLAMATGKSTRTLRRLGMCGQRSKAKSAADLVILARLIAKAQGWI